MRVAGSTKSSSVFKFLHSDGVCDSGGPQGQASVSGIPRADCIFVGMCTSNSAAGTRDVQIRI